MPNVVVPGTGMAGFGAAHRLRELFADSVDQCSWRVCLPQHSVQVHRHDLSEDVIVRVIA